MPTRAETERVAGGIVDAVRREFPHVNVHLDFETQRDEHEDAYLWIDPQTEDREEISDIWGYAMRLVQDACQEQDVYIVARMRSVGVIERDRPADQAF